MSNYGYIGKENDRPTQAFKSNAGVFSVNDIIGLDNENKWTKYGQLEHIITQTATGLTTPNYIDFSDIQSDVYNTHLLTWSAETTNSAAMYIKFFQNGVIYEGTKYDYTNRVVGASSSNEFNNTTYISLGTSKADASGSAVQGFVYLYNLGNPTEYSFTTHMSAKIDFMRVGFGVMHQHSFVDGIRLGKTGSTSYDITGASLYGIRNY